MYTIDVTNKENPIILNPTTIYDVGGLWKGYAWDVILNSGENIGFIANDLEGMYVVDLINFSIISIT